ITYQGDKREEPYAGSCPAGSLYFEDKFFAYASSEAAVAFVLAHELAHTLLRHNAERDALLQIINDALPTPYADGVIRCKKGDVRCARIIAKMKLLKKETTVLQEREADFWAFSHVVRMGYRGEDILAFLAKMGSHYGGRIATLRAFAQNEGLD